jgi:hypothetical protein
MNIKIKTSTNVSANAHGTRTRRLMAGETYRSTEPWEEDLFQRLVDAKLATKARIPPETKPDSALETK